MSHIYISLTLILIGVILAYFLLSKFLLVALFLAILAGLQFKDDFIIFRYLATHVASIYLWFCEVYNNLVNMYHQSNNVNLPVRKRIEDNGNVSNKVNRVNHRFKVPGSHNLNSTYVLETQPLGSDSWNSNPNVLNKHTLFNSRPQIPLKDLSKLNLNSTRLRQDSMNKVKLSSPLNLATTVNYDKENPKRNPNNSTFSSCGSQNDDSLLLDARLLANVNSPGFCSRLAERLGETMTHQPQYETVGAFPVVNLKSQSPKVKVKAPARVRLAPPSNDILYSSIATHSPRLIGAEESMKSVLQVLKEISRKRIHSNVDEESEDNSKRLRIGETQYVGEGSQQTSLLQQTIQGKRAREESSPNEDDIKKRHKPLQNNEILSSLSSSISIKPPHLQTQKRKALDDPIILTPVLGKLLKVQPEIISPIITPSPSNKSPVQELTVKNTPLAVPVPIVHVPTPVRPAVAPPVEVVTKRPQVDEDDDSTVSRLLGRMSRQVEHSTQQPIPVKRDMFATTNDLSLSPPKENRLAAMIAVLGGPSEAFGISVSQPDSAKGLDKPIIKGKALFTTPETPETPKSTKKVTFSDSLTATKIFDRNESSINNASSVVSGQSVVSHSTTPLSNLTFGISSSPISIDQKPSIEPQLPNTPKINDNLSFGLSQFSSGSNDPTNKTGITNTAAVSKDSTSVIQQSNTFSLPTTMVSSSFNTSSTTDASSPKTGESTFTLNTANQNNNSSEKPLPVIGHVVEKPFSFGAPTTQPDSGISLSMSNSIGKSLETRTTVPQEVLSTAKPSFNMFTNKNPTENSTLKVETNNQITNGNQSTNQSSFTFSASPSLSTSNKPTVPTFNPVPGNAPKSNSPFTFGSSSTPTTQISLPSSSSFQFSAAPQTVASLATTSSAPPTTQPNIFSNAASGPFSATVSSQNPSTFGNSMSQTKLTDSLTPVSSQNSIFGNSATSVFGTTSQTGEKKAVLTTQSNLFGGISSNTNSVAPSTGTTPTAAESTVNKGFGFVANSPFGITTSSTPQGNSVFGNSSTNTQASPMFGSVSSSTAQKVSMFSTPATTTGQPPAFPLGNTQNAKSIFQGSSTTPTATINSSSAPPAFGSQITTSNTAFGNTMAHSSNSFGSQNTTSASTFGIQSANATSFGSQTTGNNIFGNQNSSTSNTFGGQVSSSTNAFGNQSTPITNAFVSQVSSSTNAFGSQSTPTTNAFSSQITPSPNMFGNQTTSTNAFGGQNAVTSNAFGSQNSPAAGAFGNQTTTATPTFSQSQNNAISTFGNQNINKTVTFENQTKNTQPGFNASGTFSLGQNTGNTAESKPPPFGSPFMFGNTSANKESGKPIGAAAPFSFGSTAQASPSPAAPAFGTTTQQPPAFGSTVSQSTPAGPVFAFGQTPSAPGSTFQFNAASPQPVQGGGMFSIGSGSMAPRSKTGALRRRHKPM